MRLQNTVDKDLVPIVYIFFKFYFQIATSLQQNYGYKICNRYPVAKRFQILQRYAVAKRLQTSPLILQDALQFIVNELQSTNKYD